MMKFKYLNSYLSDLLTTFWTYLAFLPALYEVSSFYFKFEYLPEISEKVLYFIGALIFSIANYNVHARHKEKILELELAVVKLKSNEISYKVIAHTHKNLYEDERAKIVEAKQKINSVTSSQVILVHNVLNGITNKTWDKYQSEIKEYEEKINSSLDRERRIVRLDLQIKNTANVSDSSVRVTVRPTSEKVKIVDANALEIAEFPSEPALRVNFGQNFVIPTINYRRPSVREFYTDNETCLEVKLFEVLVGETVQVINDTLILESTDTDEFKVEIEIKSEKTRQPIIKTIDLDPKSDQPQALEL